jgi:hypothetical protein
MSTRLCIPLFILACSGDRAPISSDSGDSPPVATGETGDSSDEDSGGSEDDCEEPCTRPSEASIEQALDASLWTLETSRTRDNPLRGFMSSYLWSEPFNDFPHQLEYFYLPMSDVWGEDGETLETGLEPHLAAAADRGHHSVVRVYIDYPSKESGLPGYLAEEVSCQTYEDFGGGCSPDYDHPLLVEAMVGLIEAMGSRYDADPRLGFLQVGLLGFWGEWHTWPHEDWFPTQETQMTVLNAYDAAFQTTQMQIRLPHANSLNLRMGFHDDSFAYSTIGDVSWFFVPILESVGGDSRWQEVAIGGELRPELQGWVFDEAYELSEYQQDFDECVQATHLTYLLNYSAFSEKGTGYLGEELERAKAAALTLGYQFELAGATLSATGLLEDTVEVQVSVELSQTGVAPFYYPLTLTLHSEALGSTATSEDDLRSLLPGDSQTVVFDLGRVSVDVLSQPIEVSFSSEMLLDGQQISLATATPWDPSETQTALQWELSCQTEGGETLSVGESSGTNSDGCACVCDVDGQLRACGQDSCE